MNRNLKSTLVILLLGLTACGEPKEGTSEETANQVAKSAEPEKTLELNWEQLMPKGEEEKLEALYTEYYDEMESKFRELSSESDSEDSGAESGDSTEDLVSAIIEGSASDTMEQIGTFNVVSELNGKTIRLPGYVVPFDFSAQANYKEFLLVPYFGACLHTPPPPPNQILYVKADPGVTISDIYEPVWVEGVLKTGEFNSDLGNSAYELKLNSIEAYAY